MTDFKTYQSPFSWRYGSKKMRQIWSEENKRKWWRKLWVILAEVEMDFGLVNMVQLNNLREHMDQIDVIRAMEIEEEVKHDLMAELRTFGEQARVGGAILHLGATSMDIEDNTDCLRIRQSMGLIIEGLGKLLLVLADLTKKWAETPLIAFTHIQPAEPSTLGYRLGGYLQDLLCDYKRLKAERNQIKGKGFKGAVGTGASYGELIGIEKLVGFEEKLSQRLDLPFFEVATQTYPRKQDYNILSVVAGLGQSMSKMALDMRILQSPLFGELSEPFGVKQVGSSAMPFKRNPINFEKINSLGRYLASLPRIAWDNAANSILERTLDDSANRRVILPEAFLATDEMLLTATKILDGLVVDEVAMERNLSIYGPFAATERVMMAAVKVGADRQRVHERIRKYSMTAWKKVGRANSNWLVESLIKDTYLRKFLKKSEIKELMSYRNHLGNAPERVKRMVKLVLSELA